MGFFFMGHLRMYFMSDVLFRPLFKILSVFQVTLEHLKSVPRLIFISICVICHYASHRFPDLVLKSKFGLRDTPAYHWSVCHYLRLRLTVNSVFRIAVFPVTFEAVISWLFKYFQLQYSLGASQLRSCANLRKSFRNQVYNEFRRLLECKSRNLCHQINTFLFSWNKQCA